MRAIPIYGPFVAMNLGITLGSVLTSGCERERRDDAATLMSARTEPAEHATADSASDTTVRSGSAARPAASSASSEAPAGSATAERTTARSGSAARATAPRVVITTPDGQATVDVEVVASEANVRRGLMFRQHLPPENGMLFMMERERDWTFWMRNTLIPLDMIFIRTDMTIAGIVENAEPKTDTLRSVGELSHYVLEVNAGWARAHRVAKRATVRFENVPPNS